MTEGTAPAPPAPASADPAGAPVRGWRSAFPPLRWLAEYRPRWLAGDLVAGLTLAAYGIPVSLAYATLAGLPPHYGIYGYLFGGLGYALFGSSRQLAVGPTSAISMLVGTTVAGMAGGDPARWAEIAALTAAVVAALSLLAWIFKLSSLIAFISETILLGFKAGAALVIAMTQLPKLFGVPGGGEHFFERAAILAGQLGDTQLPVLGFGLAALAVMLLGEKLLPGRPVALLVVIGSIVAVSATALGTIGLTTVGELPGGLPALHWPALRVRDVDGVVPLAFACFLLAYIEGVSAARALADRHGQSIDPRQELLGLCGANLLAAVGQAYPVAGGLSQSSVNDKAGARTPLALVFASGAIALVLLFLTGLLANLPSVVLAAIVLVAVKGLIKVTELRELWRISRFEFGVAAVAFVGVLVEGILRGIILAAIVSILLLIRRAARPNVAILGRIPGTRRYSDLERHPENERIPGGLIVRIEAGLLYFNVEHVRDQIGKALAALPARPRFVVADLSNSPLVDLAGARMLSRLNDELAALGVRLRVAEAHASVRDTLRAAGLAERVGGVHRSTTLEAVIEEEITAQSGDVAPSVAR
ncbi:MAG TPA: SulP family inorganic anion transporter [Planctomycetota bacterium]|nr:SulP family inorganic anion transporter [Planctomycetota bacterium]